MATTIPSSLASWYDLNKNNPPHLGDAGLLASYMTNNQPTQPATGSTPTQTTSGTTNQPTNVNPGTTTTGTQTGSTDNSQATAPPTPTVTASTLSNPAQWTIDNKQTVAGQLADIEKQDSRLMQLARTQGLQQANQRGLLNSSMAIGSAQDAVMRQALPIAQFDADINAKSSGYNAETENNMRNFNAQAINRANEFNAANEFNKQQSLFEANVRASLAQIDNEAQFDRQSQNIYGGLSQEFTRAMSTINQDTNMNQQSKDYAIQQLFDAYKAQISMLSAVGSIPDVSQLLIADTYQAPQMTAQQQLAADAAARKAAGSKPTNQDKINGFAVFKNGKLVWK